MASPARRFRTLRTVGALVLREIESSNGRSSLGYLWAVVEPVAGILLMTVIFSIVFHAPPIGDSFAFFYASGFLPFTAYLDISQKVSQAIRFSRPLLFCPGVTFLDALLARFLLGALTQVVVVGAVVGAMIPLLGLEVILDLPAIGLALVFCFALALGVGSLNCFLIERFPSWERIWSIATRPLFIVSAVFFVFDGVPQPYRDWLWWNPLVHVVGQMRRGFYPSYEGAYVSAYYVLAVAGAAFLAGLVFLGRYHRDLNNA